MYIYIHIYIYLYICIYVNVYICSEALRNARLELERKRPEKLKEAKASGYICMFVCRYI